MPWACRAGQAVSSASALHSSSSSCPFATLCLFHMNEFSICCLAIVLATRPAARVLWLKHRCNRVCVCEWVCVLFSFYHTVCVFWMRHCLCLWPEQKHSGQTGSEHYEWTNIRMADRIIDARFFCWPQTRSSGSYSLPRSTRVSHAAALSLFRSLLFSAICDCTQIDRSLYRLLTSIRQFEIHVWDTVQLFHLRQAAASEHDLAYLSNRSR